MAKDYDSWNRIKKRLDKRPEKTIPPFYEREVWWVSIGVNVGYEAYGKGLPETFSRPVLILKKHNIFTFYGLPLTSTLKPDSPYHYPIVTEGKKGSVLLSQGRTLSSNRLLNRVVKIPESQFDAIKQAYKDLY